MAWQDKYEKDVDDVKADYSRLLQFTDVEREISQQVMVGFQGRVDFYRGQLRSV